MGFTSIVIVYQTGHNRFHGSYYNVLFSGELENELKSKLLELEWKKYIDSEEPAIQIQKEIKHCQTKISEYKSEDKHELIEEKKKLLELTKRESDIYENRFFTPFDIIKKIKEICKNGNLLITNHFCYKYQNTISWILIT